jgi:hypothetical protein
MGDTRGTRRLDLKEAAAELGITSEAVRRRAKRGTLASETGEDGRLYVWLPDVSDSGVHDGSHDRPHDGRSQPLPETLLERFEDENEFLRRELERLHRELERKDAILLTMAQHIPELEPAREPRESPETASDSDGEGEIAPEQEKPVSWWRKLLSG